MSPKPVCLTYEWNSWGSWMSNIRPQPIWGSGSSNHLVHSWHGPQTITRRHICLPRVNSEVLLCCKPQQLSPHRWKWQPTQEPESIKHTTKQTPTHDIRHYSGRLNPERETYLCMDPWHNWHMCEEVSRNLHCCCSILESQPNPSLCSSVSTVVAEPHRADLMLSGPQMWEQM